MDKMFTLRRVMGPMGEPSTDQLAIAIMATILLANDKGAFEAPTPIDGAVEMATTIWNRVREVSGSR